MQVRSRSRSATRRFTRPQHTGFGGAVRRFVTFVLLFSLLSYGFVFALDLRIKPVISTIGTARAKALANTSIMRAIEAELQQNGDTYNDLVTIQRGEDGAVRAVMSNIVKINQLKSRISDRVQQNLSVEMMSVSVPLGNLMGGDLLSGRGPRINFRLLPYGNVVVNVNNQFTSAGINQTLHRVLLTVDAGVSIVLPVTSVYTSASSSVVVSETIIVGQVPANYASFADMASAENVMMDTTMDKN